MVEIDKITETLLAFSTKFGIPVLRLHGFEVLGISFKGISRNAGVYWDIYLKLKVCIMLVRK